MTLCLSVWRISSSFAVDCTRTSLQLACYVEKLGNARERWLVHVFVAQTGTVEYSAAVFPVELHIWANGCCTCIPVRIVRAQQERWGYHTVPAFKLDVGARRLSLYLECLRIPSIQSTCVLQDRLAASDVKVASLELEYTEALEPAWRELTEGLDKLSAQPQYKGWMVELKEQVSAAGEREQAHYQLLLRDSVTEMYCFKVVEQQYEARVKAEICKWAGSWLNEDDGLGCDNEFHRIFQSVLDDARRNGQAAPVGESVEDKVFWNYMGACARQIDRELYSAAHGAAGGIWGGPEGTRGGADRVVSRAGLSAAGPSKPPHTLLGRVVKHVRQALNGGDVDEALLTEAYALVASALVGVDCFAANVVIEVAQKVQRLLQGTRKKDTIRKVHTFVAIKLSKSLELVQGEWDSKHNIISRLEGKRAQFKEFFHACVSFEKGVRLLALELRSALGDAADVFLHYAAVIMVTSVDRDCAEHSQPHKALCRQPWAKTYGALQVEVDFDLFNLAHAVDEGGEGALESFLDSVAKPALHHDDVVRKLISDQVCFCAYPNMLCCIAVACGLWDLCGSWSAVVGQCLRLHPTCHTALPSRSAFQAASPAIAPFHATLILMPDYPPSTQQVSSQQSLLTLLHSVYVMTCFNFSLKCSRHSDWAEVSPLCRRCHIDYIQPSNT
jgi:hypothetical protein